MTLSLNPCSNGMRIERGGAGGAGDRERCLNPCSNGMRIEPAFYERQREAQMS